MWKSSWVGIVDVVVCSPVLVRSCLMNAAVDRGWVALWGLWGGGGLRRGDRRGDSPCGMSLGRLGYVRRSKRMGSSLVLGIEYVMSGSVFGVGGGVSRWVGFSGCVGNIRITVERRLGSWCRMGFVPALRFGCSWDGAVVCVGANMYRRVERHVVHRSLIAGHVR